MLNNPFILISIQCIVKCCIVLLLLMLVFFLFVLTVNCYFVDLCSAVLWVMVRKREGISFSINFLCSFAFKMFKPFLCILVVIQFLVRLDKIPFIRFFFVYRLKGICVCGCGAGSFSYCSSKRTHITCILYTEAHK